MKCLHVCAVLVAVSALHVASASSPSAVTEQEGEKKKKKSWVTPIKVQARKFVSAAPYYYLESYIDVNIGTPRQTVPLMFDTGSFLPLVYNASCNTVSCGHHARYNSAKSSTSIVSDVVSNETYGAGNAVGWWTQDFFSLKNGTMGGAGSTQIDFHQNFTLAMSVNWRSDQQLQNWNFSGIFGLGPPIPYNYPFGSNTHIFQQHGVTTATIKVTRGLPISSDEPGRVQFGGHDKLVPPGSHITWVPIMHLSTPWQYWMPIIDDVLVNNVSTQSCSAFTGQCYCLFDTGGGAMSMLGLKVERPSLPTWIPCADVHTLPNVTLVIGGTPFTMEGQDYTVHTPEGKCQVLLLTSDGRNRRDGLPQVHSLRPVPSRMALRKGGQQREGEQTHMMDLGIMWMSRVTTIIDWKNMKMGFSQHD